MQLVKGGAAFLIGPEGSWASAPKSGNAASLTSTSPTLEGLRCEGRTSEAIRWRPSLSLASRNTRIPRPIQVSVDPMPERLPYSASPDEALASDGVPDDQLQGAAAFHPNV